MKRNLLLEYRLKKSECKFEGRPNLKDIRDIRLATSNAYYDIREIIDNLKNDRYTDIVKRIFGDDKLDEYLNIIDQLDDIAHKLNSSV